MQDPIILGAIIIGVAVVLATVVLVFGRLKLEQQRTLQLILEKDETTRGEWGRLLAIADRPTHDFRRGVLLIVVGATLTLIMFFLGGIGWLLGLIPVLVGATYLLFWRLARHGDSR